MTKQIGINLVHSATGAVVPTPTRAVVRGEWALHRSLNLFGDSYAFTHIPSGLCIDFIEGTPVRLADALRGLAALPPCPVDPRTLVKPYPVSYRNWALQVAAETAAVRS